MSTILMMWLTLTSTPDAGSAYPGDPNGVLCYSRVPGFECPEGSNYTVINGRPI